MAYQIQQDGGGTVRIHFEDWVDLGKAMKEVIIGDPNLFRTGIGIEEKKNCQRTMGTRGEKGRRDVYGIPRPL